MSPQHAIIEFQDQYCHLYAWQSNKGVYTLKSLTRIPLDKPEDANARRKAMQDNAEALKQAFKSAELTIREATAVVPKQWVTLRIVTLPATDPQELNEMARFEAERHIPFNVERHVISHHILQTEDIHGTQVIIAAIDGPPAREITDMADAAGIRINALEVSSVAQANALRHSGEWDTEAYPTATLIDLGLSSTDITILHKGKPIFARSIALGVERIVASMSPDAESGKDITLEQLEELPPLDLPEEEKAPSPAPDENLPGPPPQSKAGSYADSERFRSWSQRLIQEIRRTYDFARREFECEPLSRVFLSGVGAGLRNLDGVFNDALNIRPQPLNPLSDSIRVDKEAASLTLSPPSYVTAVGGLIHEIDENALRINLLPEEYLRKHQRSQRKRALTTTGALALGLIVCIFILGNQVIASRKRQLDFYRSEVNANENRVEEIRYRQTVIRILRENASEQGSALAILNTISQWVDLFNDQNMRVAIKEFIYEAGKSVKINGEARSVRDLNEFVARLKATDHFPAEDVLIASRSTKPAPHGLQPVVDFTVNCKFKEKD